MHPPKKHYPVEFRVDYDTLAYLTSRQRLTGEKSHHTAARGVIEDVLAQLDDTLCEPQEDEFAALVLDLRRSLHRIAALRVRACARCRKEG